jgi:hypothetical protein
MRVISPSALTEMSRTHASKKGVRYRYYVSQTLIAPRQGKSDDRHKSCHTGAASTGQRLPAAGIERLVLDRLLQFLATRSEVLAAVASTDDAAADPSPSRDAIHQSLWLDAAERQASRLNAADAVAQRSFLLTVLQGIDVHRDHVDLRIHQSGLLQHLGSDDDHGPVEASSAANGEAAPVNAVAGDILTLILPVAFRRSGFELRLIVPGKAVTTAPDPSLIRLLARAHQIRDRLFADPDWTISQLADQGQLTASYVTRLLRLAFLAPDIITAILDGRQPVELTANKLMADTRLPIDWAVQRQALGFA